MLQQTNEYDIFIFFQKQTLTSHIQKVHNTPKEFKCRRCEYRTFSRKFFCNHMGKMHELIYNIRCKYEGCDKVYAEKTKLRTHINSAHLGIKRNRGNLNAPKEIKCRRCEYTTFSKKFYHNHMEKMHKVNFNFSCEYEGCDYVASDNSKLQRHINSLVHSDVKR